MKKIAIIAPCILPVPASRGGAVEELITCIINQNEISKQYAIDLYTIADFSYNLKNYSYTNIIPISLDNITSKLDRVCDKYYRTVKNKSAKRFYDKQIISKFMEESSKMDGSYFAVIVENQMSLAIELLKHMDFSRDYPIYYHMHNDVDIYRTPEYIEILVKNGVQFIAVSNYIKSQILKYSDKALVHVLYNGISFDEYPKTTRGTDGKVKFLYVGRIIAIKGVVELIEAFVRMRSKLPDNIKYNVQLELIGFSETLTKFEEQVFNMAGQYAEFIHCSKRLSTMEMAEEYNNYDVVVMPTLQEESFGLVALETMAKGIPLIVTNSGGVPEVVGEGAIVINKEENLIDDLATAMEKLATNEAFRVQLGKKAFSEARRVVEFNINTYYHRLVDILDTKCSQISISIIVPVYNVEDHLERCIKSLINQTYREVEIILVDDGSTDNSGTICDKYADVDSRIKVVHQKNRGLSGARNTGLDVSTGSYIFFVDSDDYIDKSTIEKMFLQSKRCNADVVSCGFSHVFNDKLDSPFTNQWPGIWSGREAVIQMMTNNNLCTTAWNKLYKSELWNNVRFPEGRLHEDEASTYKVIYNANIVAYIPECLYKYYQRTNSIMTANVGERYKDYIVALQERIGFFRYRNEDYLADYSVSLLLDYFKYVYRNTDNQIKESIKLQYNLMLKEYGIPKKIKLKKKLSFIIWKFVKA